MNFKETLKKIMDRQSKPFDNNPKEVSITEADFSLLSKFERNTLKTIGKMYGILTAPGKDIDYSMLRQIINQLPSSKSDIEKHYLLALFFPEKIKNIHTIYRK